MQNKDLQELLKQYPDDAVVYVPCDELDGDYVYMQSIERCEDENAICLRNYKLADIT